MAKKEKKPISLVLLVFFIVFSVLVVVFGYFHIIANIYSPFTQSMPKYNIQENNEQELAILNNQDTDNDGLTDLDEKFVYNTSAYLADTDSDNYSDKDEIDADSDPLDPKSFPGRNFIQVEQESDLKFFQEVIPDFEQIQQIGQEVTPEQIRQLLIEQGGLSKDVVDKLNDKALMNLYNETKEQTGIDLKDFTSLGGITEKFSNLSIQEIRQLLIEQGIDEQMLNTVDDETLKNMFFESLSQIE